MTKVCVLITGCVRYSYLEETLKSFFENISFAGLEVEYHLFEDMSPYYNAVKLREICEKYPVNIHVAEQHLGLSRNVLEAWKTIPECDYIWHQENDFIFMKKIKVKDLVEIFENCPLTLKEITLLRFPVVRHEILASGVIQFWGDKMQDYSFPVNDKEKKLVIHRSFFSLNPSLYPYSITRINADFNEKIELRVKELILEENPEAWFSYLGAANDKPLCYHIGNYTLGSGH
jgi:hypothetical protein